MSLVSEHFRDGENPVLVGEQGRHLTMSALKLVGEYFHIFSEKGLFDFEGLGEYSINQYQMYQGEAPAPWKNSTVAIKHHLKSIF